MDIRSLVRGAPSYVNQQAIPTTIGRNNLPLSRRSISDILEKWVMDFLLSNHGDLVQFKSGPGYDFIIAGNGETAFVNIKTEYGKQEYSWLCSSSVLTKRKDILDKLYFYKLTYTEVDKTVRVTDAAIAGPLQDLITRRRIVIHTKGEPLPEGIARGELPTHYNGEHCFLRRENFRPLSSI